jgi:uncharacterized Zn finger protein
MALRNLSEAAIRQQASAESFQRGRDYYQTGAVVSLLQRGDTLQAEVEGSQYEPYQVCVTFDEAGIIDADCSCPYDWGGWCKHVVAALLSSLHHPEAIEVRLPLEELLTDLGREPLHDLVLHLATSHPHLVEQVERYVSTLRSAHEDAPALQEATTTPRRTAVDPRPLRRQVRAILHSLDRLRRSKAYWHVGDVVGQVRETLDQVTGFVEAGDGQNALLLLEAITDEYVEGWVYLDDSDGDAGGFFGELGTVWLDAALVADLSSAERGEWVEKLAHWRAEISEYSIDDPFGATQAALQQGWDYPPLQRVLQGEITQLGAWEGEAPWFADDLALARLQVLERQGRYQEYLYLAEAESQTQPYVTMLARLGRTREAVDEGLQYLSTPDEILALTKALREKGEIEAALRVAEHGLTLEGHKGALATWLCDLARGAGRTELALQAALAAFHAAPGLEAYQRVQELAGERWLELRRALLAHLRQGSFYTQAQVDVFLHEGLLDDAIAAVSQGGGYTQIERVMDAVLEHRPDWVIRSALQQAKRIIEPGQAKYYHHAVAWLARARDAYKAAGREDEWRVYLRDLYNRHGRKHKLVGLLKGL